MAATNDNSPLRGSVAIVTGASSGIGRETALTLSRAGASVSLCARRVELLEKLAAEITEGGGVALALQVDVTDRAQVKAAVARTEKELGPVDILVNNAGLWYTTFVTSLHEQDWDTMIDVNCKGVMNCIGAVVKDMVARRTGHIVNISSECGRKGFEGMAVYCGTKFFVEGMSSSLRLEVAKHGVKVTNIQPGEVNTPGSLLSHDKEAIDKCSPPADIELLEATDIAQAVLYAVTQPKRVAISEVFVQNPDLP